MPNATGSPARREELVCKIKQHPDSGARGSRDTQIGPANQQPSMIMINSPISEIKSHPSHVTATVIHREEKAAGQPGEFRLGAESGIQPGSKGPYIYYATANAGQRRRDDVANPLVGVGRQEARVPYCSDETTRERVGQAAKLETGAGREL
jgi:hypothetical protein